jgi:hypothetical protein
MSTPTTRAPASRAESALDEKTASNAPRRESDRRPIAVLVTVVLGIAVLYAAAAQLVSTPRVHPDEHIYAGGGASLAEGEGLTLRGEPYPLGALYPTLLAAILAPAGDRETAYHVWKAANALLFALAAIPIYLVARRLLRPWWSVGAATLSIAIPSSMYVSLVMTESVSYLTYAIALWAIVLALERPSTGRQAAVLAAVTVAYLTRAQFAVLFAAYAIALAIVWALTPNRPPVRDSLRRLWPTLAAVVVGALVLIVRPLVTGASPLDAVGAYEVLFRGYDPIDIVKWIAYHLADLELYLAVVPIAVSPIVVSLLWREARDGMRPAAAFVAAFLTVNGAMLFVTAAFASTEFGFDRLHDRNVFYLAPLWLLVLTIWLAKGLPRRPAALATGLGLALLLPAALPWRYIASDVGVDVIPSAFWARLDEALAGEVVTARKLAAIAVLVLVAVAALLPRRLRLAIPMVVIATFAVTATLAWNRIVDATENAVFEGGLDRSWVDDRLPEGSSVTKLYLVTTKCPASAVTWHALYLTEFFNRTVERVASVGDSITDGLPIERVDVDTDGVFKKESGASLETEYVVTQPGIELDGQQLATGTNAGLVLWRTDGEVRVLGARSDEDLRTADCS